MFNGDFSHLRMDVVVCLNVWDSLGQKVPHLIGGGLVVVGQHLVQNLRSSMNLICHPAHHTLSYTRFVLVPPDLVIQLGVVDRQADVGCKVLH